MAPARTTPSPFSVAEKVFCFHHDMLYEASVLQAENQPDGWKYKIHYKGWKNTWDDWVGADRVRKFNEENRELAMQLKDSVKAATQIKKGGGKGAKAGAKDSEMGSTRGSEERTAAATSSRGAARRTRDYELETEESFHARPSIKLTMPDHLKSALVDDWENVTKNNQLVPLPHPHPVKEIMADYLAKEREQREPGTADHDILMETVSGFEQYFNKALGRILLYRFERRQYADLRADWEAKPDGEHTCPWDTYGVEHLCRLIVSLPELVAQTNMDQQSVNRLREEMAKVTNFIGRNASKYFVSEYETPGQDYIQRAR